MSPTRCTRRHGSRALGSRAEEEYGEHIIATGGIEAADETPLLKIDALCRGAAEAIDDTFANTTDTLTNGDKAAPAAKKAELNAREARLVAAEVVLEPHVSAGRILPSELPGLPVGAVGILD